MCAYLEYNGIRIELTKTIRYTRDYLWSQDGSDYLGTRVTIEVEGVYSPFAMSYGEPLLEGGDPVDLAGFIAPTTDVAIRHYLSQPRCRLRYVVGDVTVVESPAPGQFVDAANGPTPRSWEAVKVTERTWHIRFRVETTVVECGTTESGLLSNRWSMAHSIGDDRLTTIVTEGVAVFRTDRLAQVGRNADFFRDRLIPPAPQGFRRMRINIVVNPVGNIIQYSVVDQELFVYLGANSYGVVDFKAAVSLHSVPIGNGALSSVASSVMLASFQGTALGTKGPGYRSGNLLTWLTALAIQRLNLPVGQNKKPGENDNYIVTQVDVESAIERPMTSLSITVRIPPAKDNDAKPGLGPLRALELMEDVRDSPLFNFDGITEQMPRGNNNRGYYLGELYAQALRSCLANCGQPTIPAVIATVSPSYFPYQAPGTNPPGDPAPPAEDPYTGDNQLAYSDEARSGGSISYYEARSHYATDTGVVVASVTGSRTDPPLAFRLQSPKTVRIVQFTGERIGGKPPIPNPASNDLGEVLVGAPQISFTGPTVAPDGRSRIYRVAGEFAYTRIDGKSLLEPGDGLSMGAVPWARFNFNDDDNKLLASDLRHGITGPRETIYPSLAGGGDGGGATT